MYEKPLANNRVQSRKGIAMIELIFAIVIIGITLLSVPNLVYQASESGYTTIQQESIAAAASDLSLILSREWDETGTTDAFHTPLLTTTNGTSSLSTRPGGRSRVFTTSVGGPALPADATLGAESGDMDDIDDAHYITGTVTLIDGTKDLIDINISIATTVNYIVDTSDTGAGDNWNNTAALAFNTPFTPDTTGTTNIKRVSITLTSNSSVAELADKEIVFNAFSCNVGSYKLERRELP